MIDSDEFDLAETVLRGPATAATPAQCRAASALGAALALAAPPVEPPAAIRTHLLAAIAAGNVYYQHAAEAAWEPTGVPGLTRRTLFVDQRQRRATLLLRLEAGGRIPAHPHAGIEEVFLLEGELHSANGPVLQAGDYQRSEPGSVHVDQWTVNGCTALMIVPLSQD